MRNLFAIVFVLSFVSGCYLSHERPVPVIPMEDSGPIFGDAGPMPVVDSGVIMSDAGSDAMVPPEALLTVGLYDGTPPSRTIPRNATGIAFTVFDFVTGALPVPVNGLEVRRVGVGATFDFSSVYLFDNATGSRLTTGRSINATTNTAIFHFWPPVELPPHAVWSVALGGEMNASSPVAGGQHAFEITSADAVFTDGSIPVSGDFPVRGSVFTVGTHMAPRLDIRQGLPAPDVYVGDRGAEVSNFTLTASGDFIDVLRLNLQYGGSASTSDLNPTAAIVDADHRPIDLLPTWWDENGFLIIQPNPGHLGIGDGETTSISVFMGIGGPAGRTIKLYVEYPIDVFAAITPMVSWSPVAVCTSPLVTGGCSAEGQGSFDGSTRGTYSEVTIR